jgi:hypothetical protein
MGFILSGVNSYSVLGRETFRNAASLEIYFDTSAVAW